MSDEHPFPRLDAPLDWLTLEQYRVAVAARMPREMFGRRVDAHVSEDFLRNELTVRLETYVWAHHVLTDDVHVRTEGQIEVTNDDVPESVLIELPRPWWRRLLRRPARTMWCPVVGNAIVHNGSPTVRCTGTAVVPVRYLRAFPDASFAYPDSLGEPRQIQMVMPANAVPDWRM